MKDEGGNGAPALRERTKKYALRVIRLYQALPSRDGVAQVLGKQLLRSGTSVAAHYREACRAKSDSETIKRLRFAPLLAETNELMAILVTIIKKLKGRP